MSQQDRERFVDLAMLRRIARVELDLVADAAARHGCTDAAKIDRVMLRRIARIELNHADRVAAAQAREAATAHTMTRLIAERMAPVFRRADDHRDRDDHRGGDNHRADAELVETQGRGPT